MKKIYKALNIISILAVMIVVFVACDEDFTTLESDININDNFSTNSIKYAVRAYTRTEERVQTNNLPTTLVGVYNDPFYGTTSSDLVSQMSPTVFGIDFGEDVELDSVVLNIPYFSTFLEIDEDGTSTYKLDSTYGNSPINLSIFRNNYFLRDFVVSPDPEFNESLVYFSDGLTSEGTQIDPLADVQGQPLYQDIQFIPSAKQIILKDQDDVITRFTPSLRIRLDEETENEDGNDNTTVYRNKEYWTTLILDKEDDIELSNQNNFLDYFRGLYIKSEAFNGDGNMFALDLNSASLTLHYSSTQTDIETQEETIEQGLYAINFLGNRFNLINNNGFSPNDGDEDTGDETLFLQGSEGSFAVINLFDEDIFGSSLCDFLEDFRSNYVCNTLNDGEIEASRLINEAFIKFHVDQSITQNAPERVFLYDIENQVPIVDFFLDQTSNKINHLEAVKSSDGNGMSYKVRVTEYMNAILLRDSTNLKLGLAVSNNLQLEGSTETNLNIVTNDEDINTIPVSTVITPEGVVLHGSNPNVPEATRIQLEVFYTCLNIDDNCSDNEDN